MFHDLFTSLHEGDEEEGSCASVQSSAEVLMAGTNNGLPGFPKHQDGHGRRIAKAADDALGGSARVGGKAPPPTREQIDKLNRVTEQTLHTLITTTTPEALVLESA